MVTLQTEARGGERDGVREGEGDGERERGRASESERERESVLVIFSSIIGPATVVCKALVVLLGRFTPGVFIPLFIQTSTHTHNLSSCKLNSQREVQESHHLCYRNGIGNHPLPSVFYISKMQK